MTIASIVQPDNVAVVTGAALGIGRAMCKRFAQAGMSVVLADLPGDDLDAAAHAMGALSPRGPGAILAAPTNVADPEQILRLRDTVIAKLGKVNLLANNAATRVGRGHEADLGDWRQAMEVNFWGPIVGVRAFLPAMLASGEPGAIVNVGSKQGITNPPGHPIYNISKSALKTYTEALEHDLRSNRDNQNPRHVTAHLLIPGWTTTGTHEHKPGAWLPEQVVDMMLSGMANGDFYIVCPDDEVTADMDRKRILWAAGDVTENRPPLSRWHPDYADSAKKACS
jgi:NAD(P)-dependent dehydrogenase (short-subunit alcohol dehydrogenase family)